MRMTMFMLLATGFASQAQQVYKCSDGDGVTYQSQPCGQSQRTVKQWDATPDPAPPAKKVATAVAEPKPGSARTQKNRTRHARPRVDPAEARCNSAKARREAKLKAVGLKRTYDLLRALDEAVHEACR